MWFEICIVVISFVQHHNVVLTSLGDSEGRAGARSLSQCDIPDRLRRVVDEVRTYSRRLSILLAEILLGA